MISPFLTTNIFLINLAVMLLTTTITGGIVTLVWLTVGKMLEKIGFVNIVYELMKLAAFFFLCPVAYIFLKVFEMEVGRGYLFSPTGTILSCTRIFLVLWGSGTLCMLIYMLRDIRVLKKLYRDAFLCAKDMQDIYVRSAEQLGFREHIGRKPPQLVWSYYAKVPCIKGIFRPMVVLPVRKYSEEELEVIFAHELIHYKQGDVLLKRCMMILLAVNFYNPLAWLLFKRVHRWSEYACDYRACEETGGMKHYFEVILNMSVQETMHTRLSSQLVEDQHELVGRVRSLKQRDSG